ncbi:TrkH family potassium uptake protein [bacterium]|nr:TrkH family potassium uptake protein [bacterium]
MVLIIGGLLMLTPVLVTAAAGGSADYGRLFRGFILPGGLASITGLILKRLCPLYALSLKDSMAVCTLSWILLAVIGAVPFMVIHGTPFLDAFFETMSGYTTTGITMLTGLEEIPRPLLFWRALTQWIGGLGILSMFILLGFKGGAAANKLFMAEGHKVATRRPFPGMFQTARVLWLIYIGMTLLQTLVLLLLKTGLFDALTHSFTTISTGGYSIYDNSIASYRLTGHPFAHLIELTVMVFMIAGGMNFFIHFRIWNGDIRSLWDSTEIRYFWGILLGGIFFVWFTSVRAAQGAYSGPGVTAAQGPAALLLHLKDAAFQTVSILTTTGYATRDIASPYFAPLARQIFLVLMVIGGCAGSTGGGIKVIRVAILTKLVKVRLFRLSSSRLSRTPLTIDNELVSAKEINTATSLFFVWILLLLLGGGITALFSDYSGWQSFSGMFSALGNIGPCYLTVPEIIGLHPVIKITYIFGMLAGRLEIIPVILLFSRKFYR